MVACDPLLWDWTILSTEDDSQLEAVSLTHCEGRLQVYSPDHVAYQAEFRLLECLVSNQECGALLRLVDDIPPHNEGDNDTHIVQGSTVYGLFDNVSQYGEPYRRLKRVVHRGDSTAGYVLNRRSSRAQSTGFDAEVYDAFNQVGNLAMNCMHPRGTNPKKIWLPRGCRRWIRSPWCVETPEIWDVLVRHRRQAKEEDEETHLHEMDVFVFDPASGALTEALLGVQLTQIPRDALGEMLGNSTKKNAELITTPTAATTTTTMTCQDHHREPRIDQSLQLPAAPINGTEVASGQKFENVLEDVRTMIASLLGVNAAKVTPNSQLADLGMDSLSGIELASDIQGILKCSPNRAEMMEASSLEDLASCIWKTLQLTDAGKQSKSGKCI
ncbi:hypothetical protein FE257_008224 [Aspergillus nanangensis]|uniref:Carrier domain-containing protein n=1 Tax=Aspergillus nanangensis TaxID=2582783 RepID=A0AAD4CLR4_ASPNN|nr:hypothetical protein FE257_008224 [Aspergillus nanangensis]